MIIEYHPNFKKNYRRRISSKPSLIQKYQQRVDIFLTNPRHPLLKDHPLTGTLRRFRSFSFTRDVRIIYQLISPNKAIFYDIGTYNQVY